MATGTSVSITLKLLIDSNGKKVLFAEAGKEFVDFLFTLLSLPIGTAIKLLSSNDMVGSLGKLYDSFNSLSNTYIEPNVNKDVLLSPKSSIGSPSATLLSLTNDTSSGTKQLFICNNCRTCGSDDPTAVCCRYQMKGVLSYVAPPAKVGSTSEGGFVKGVVTYMIMDDLEVRPMSTISSITMLNKFKVKEVGALQENTVTVGMKEGLKLLKTSLQSDSVLTNVFLGK